jgi:hypothetical protein
MKVSGFSFLVGLGMVLREKPERGNGAGKGLAASVNKVA